LSIRAVKGFVVLAIVLLIPTIGYFQKQHFEHRLRPQLKAAVEDMLKEEGVENPSVNLTYLDAVIAGRVETDAQRTAVAARINAMPGVRVPPGGNKLHTFGWIRIARSDERYRGEGVISKDLGVGARLGKSHAGFLKLQVGWDDDLERRETVEVPEAVERWDEFLLYYFRGTGNRSVELRVGGLTMRGDATAGLRSDWLSKASEVVAKNEVFDEFALHPSIYHFPGYLALSMTDETTLAGLRKRLGANTVEFVVGKEELPNTERGKAVAAARAILNAGEHARYVVGGHPARTGNVTSNGQLARKRAQEVVKVLVEHGVLRSQLEVVSFGVTTVGKRDNQVEIVVK
jgi:outer membrane protein OmpA-like peptidoglycan-associated protein